jgi:Transcriptional regulator, AbiEi antitoxin
MALATRQHGVVSTRQLEPIGYSPSSVAKAEKSGRLHRLHRGVYAVGHRRLTWHARCWAAVLAAESNETDEVVWPAVASHGSAAYLWGILRYAPETIDVTAPTRRRAKREFRVHFSSILAAEDRGEQEGIPVTSVPRTLLDLAARSRPARLERYLEWAEERDLFDLYEVQEVLDRAGGHRGRGPLRRALAIYEPEPAFTRSGLEKRFLALVRRAGLPIPAVNYVVAGMELDTYWEEERFAVELDVYETHGSHAAFERDRQRPDDLLLQGIETIRVTGPRLKREPQATIERVSRHLARRRRELRR